MTSCRFCHCILLLLWQWMGGDEATKPFYIRHFNGKCAQFDTLTHQLIWVSVCRDKFKWKDGIRLIDIHTQKCLVPKERKFVTLTNNCAEMDTMYKLNAASGTIKHLLTGNCIQSGNTSTVYGNALVMVSNCKSENARVWLLSDIMYTVRHISGLCLVHDADNNLLKLVNTSICDRFVFLSINKLQHVKTSKCLGKALYDAVLKHSCESMQIILEFTSNNNIYDKFSNVCFRPKQGTINPSDGSTLVVAACSDQESDKFYLYDDRGILNVKMISESCDDVPKESDCGTIPRGHIFLNGYQHGKNGRGINVVVLDYRSGLVEITDSYYIFTKWYQQYLLTRFLNGLKAGKILMMVAKDAVEMNNDLITALRKHGVSATFATTSIPKHRCSLASISYTGKIRMVWEESVNRVGCVGASVIEKTIYLFHDWKSVDECTCEMGLRTGKIANSKLTASSVWSTGGNHEAKNARLHDSGWCAASYATAPHFVQIDLSTAAFLTGIAIQPAGTMLNSVTSFSLKLSIDGILWSYYSENLNQRKIFVGPEAFHGRTVVSWISRTFTRFVRINEFSIASMARAPCLKVELFGCYPGGPIFIISKPDSKEEYIMNKHNEEFFFSGFVSDSEMVQIGISTSPNATNIGTETNEQQHFDRINQTTILFGGTVVNDVTNITKQRNDLRQIVTSAAIDYSVKKSGYYNFKVNFESQILDTGASTNNNIWKVYSFITDNRSHFICMPVAIKRAMKDESLLSTIISKSSGKKIYKKGDAFNFTMLLAHKQDQSYANAHSVNLTLSYDKRFLSMRSFRNLHQNPFSIALTRNRTGEGYFQLYSDTLWLLNNHYIEIDMLLSYVPDIVTKHCKADIIIDLRYRTNLVKFGGQMRRQISNENLLDFSISKEEHTQSLPGTIAIPEFSMAYDDVNNDFYVCKKRTKNHVKNRPSCYLRKHNQLQWISLPYIISIAGIDTKARELYGYDANQMLFIKSVSGFAQINEVQWTSIQNQPHVRKAKTCANVTSLPSNPTADWVLPSVTNQQWVVTKNGVMKKEGVTWKYVMQFQ